MIALLRAELHKVVRTRSLLIGIAAAVGYPLLAIAAAASAPSGQGPGADREALFAIVRGTAYVAKVLVLMIAIVAVGGEYRHGTIVPTLLATPRRAVVVAGKVGAMAGTGFVVSVAASVVALLAGSAYLASEAVTVAAGAIDLLLAVAGAAVVVGCYGAIGASLGWITRNQPAAMAGGLIWVLALEELVPIVFRSPDLGGWLPGGAAARVLRLGQDVPGMPSAAAAALVLASVTAALVAVALARTVDTDVQ